MATANNNNSGLGVAVAPTSPASSIGSGGVMNVNVNVNNNNNGGNDLGQNHWSLYVGDLDRAITEAHLLDLFGQAGPVASVKVCRDQTKSYSLGYAYVNFRTPHDAATAMEMLNFTPMMGKPIRIMYSLRDPSLRKSGYANIFIKNLDSSIDNKSLHDTFAAFGNILSCKVAVDNNGNSKGYGFVQFDTEEAAQKAISSLNGMLLNDKQVYVGHFARRQQRGDPSKFTNVYVKNLAESTTDEDLKNIFEEYGSISSAKVMKDANGKSKGFGFVNFGDSDSAASAVEKLNGSQHGDRVWYVGRAQKKAEREAELRAKFEQERKNHYQKFQGSNLYLKNLDATVNDEKLKELFSEFGSVTSCKVMLDAQGRSKGCGFVAFATPDEATKAIAEMNGKMIGKKPLYVAVAERKEDRKARLSAHYAPVPMHGVGFIPISPGFPGSHPMYYGRGGMGIRAPGYGLPQFMPGHGTAQGFISPYHQRHGQMGPHTGGARRNNSLPEDQQNKAIAQNPTQGVPYISNVQNGVASPAELQGLLGRVPPVRVPLSALASSLAASPPENHKTLLGEHLYPLVQQMAPENPGKVTGMLLEMDQREVLHLMESPEALRSKVAEAMDVLHASSGSVSSA